MIAPAALALAASVLLGLGLVLAPRGLARLSPLQGAGIGIPTAAIALAVLSLFAVDWSGLNLGAVALFVAIGLFFPVAATVLTIEADRVIGPGATGALGNLAPLFAVFIAISALGEAPSLAEGIGIAVIVIGATALVSGAAKGPAGWPRWAIALPLLAALIWGAAYAGIKIGLAVWPEPLAASVFGYLASSLIIAGWARLRDPHPLPMLDRRGVRWFALVGLCNGAAVLAIYTALERGSVVLIAPLVATYPLMTLGLGLLFGDRPRLTTPVVLGAIATVAGAGLLLSG